MRKRGLNIGAQSISVRDTCSREFASEQMRDKRKRLNIKESVSKRQVYL
jgi:hypothetical protein